MNEEIKKMIDKLNKENESEKLILEVVYNYLLYEENKRESI